MPQCVCCVEVNRSPKYTTDRLETKQYSQLSKLLAYTQKKQISLKSYFTQAHKCPSASAVYTSGKQVTQVYNLYTTGSFRRHKKGPSLITLFTVLFSGVS